MRDTSQPAINRSHALVSLRALSPLPPPVPPQATFHDSRDTASRDSREIRFTSYVILASMGLWVVESCGTY